MGCDIHGPWVITRVTTSSGSGAYVRCIAKLNWDRDYDVFGLVADVRNEDHEWEAIDAPRGFPPDEWLGSAKYWLDDHGDSSDCHSASWLTTNEVVEAQRRYAIPDGHRASDLMHAIMLMRGYEQEWKTMDVTGEIRLVFCFDD